jgi:phosphoribosylglycinamide formyltransferase-1
MKNEDTKKLHIAIFASHRGTNMQAIIDACKRGDLNGEVCVVISNIGFLKIGPLFKD